MFFIYFDVTFLFVLDLYGQTVSEPFGFESNRGTLGRASCCSGLCILCNVVVLRFKHH